MTVAFLEQNKTGADDKFLRFKMIWNEKLPYSQIYGTKLHLSETRNRF